jgi:hypothetical protein
MTWSELMQLAAQHSPHAEVVFAVQRCAGKPHEKYPVRGVRTDGNLIVLEGPQLGHKTAS